MYKKVSLLVSLIIIATMLLSACAPQAATPQPNEQPAATALPEVTLSWHLDGNAPTDELLVEEAINALPQMKALNAKVDLMFYDWGAFDQKMQLMFSGNEECDLVFTASWANNYTNNAVNGTIIALDDLLPKYAPKIWSTVPKNAWEMSKVNGKIYAIPNQQLWYEAWGIILDKSIADKYNIDLTKINRLEDLDPYLAEVAKGEPQLAKKLIGEPQGTTFHPLYWGYDNVNGGGVIKRGDTARKVVNFVETDEFRKAAELARSWYEAGYSPDEPLEIAGGLDPARREGLFPFKFHVAKPGVEAEEKAITGREQVAKSLQEPVLSYVTPTMTGVCSTSKNPERALQVFELFYTDEVVYNTLAKGIEGKHWAWVDKDKKVIGFPEGVTADNSGWNLNRDWMIGNQFIAYYLNPDQVGAWEETDKINKSAGLPMAGPFVFDPTPVQAEITALDAANQQFLSLLQWGLVDPDDPEKGVDAYIAAQKKAGVDKIMAEIQKQLDAFVQANPDLFK